MITIGFRAPYWVGGLGEAPRHPIDETCTQCKGTTIIEISSNRFFRRIKSCRCQCHFSALSKAKTKEKEPHIHRWFYQEGRVGGICDCGHTQIPGTVITIPYADLLKEIEKEQK